MAYTFSKFYLAKENATVTEPSQKYPIISLPGAQAS
jgi:hypothetical protein